MRTYEHGIEPSDSIVYGFGETLKCYLFKLTVIGILYILNL